MRPGKKKRRQLERLQHEMERQAERNGIDLAFMPRLIPEETNLATLPHKAQTETGSALRPEQN